MRSKSQLSPIISQFCQVLTPWVGNKYLQKLETKSVWNGFDWFSSDLILEPNQQPIFNGCSVKKPSFMYVKIIQLISNPSFQFVDVWGSRMYVIDIRHDCWSLAQFQFIDLFVMVRRLDACRRRPCSNCTDAQCAEVGVRDGCLEIGKKNGACQLAAVFFVYRSDFSHVESRFAILLLSFLSWLLDGFDIVHFASTVFFMLT